MHVGGVQHRVHVTGGHHGDKRGGFTVVAHGGWEGQLRVVGELGGVVRTAPGGTTGVLATREGQGAVVGLRCGGCVGHFAWKKKMKN